MKKNRWLIYIVILAVIVMSTWILFRREKNKVYVKTTEVEIGDISKYINLIGEVSSKNINNYYVINGIVNVKVGDKVNVGDIIGFSIYGAITSSSEGVVTSVNSFSGNSAVEVQDISDIKVEVNVNKNDYKYINIGQKAIVYDYDGNELNGEVYYLSAIAEKSGNSFTDGENYVKAYINVDNADLVVGFTVEADILVDSKSAVTTIPVETLIKEKNDKNYIYILENNIVERREIQVGLESEDLIEIISGVNDGEEIILNPTNNIKGGEKVYRRE